MPRSARGTDTERDPGVMGGAPLLWQGGRLKALGSLLGLALLAQDAGAGPARLAGVEPASRFSIEVSSIRSRQVRGADPLGQDESVPEGSRALDLAGTGSSQDSLQGLTQVRALAREARTVAAVRLADTLPADLNGAIARVEARYWAGDLAGALASARPALETWPQDPQLLLLSSELALQLLLPAEALRWSELLVGLDGSKLDPEVAAFYRDRGMNLVEEARASAAWERRHEGVTLATRLVAVLGLLVCVAAIILQAREASGSKG